MRRSVICAGFFLSVLLLWPLYQGKLWIIDDHEIVSLNSMMEKAGSGLLPSFRAGLAETEAAHWGESGRYRPVRYFRFVLETYLFGTNAGGWFLCNFLFFFLSIVCAGISIHYFFPPPFVFPGMLFFAALPCYAGMWGRLGPNEIDGCLWTTLFLYGFARYMKKARFAWATMCFSVFMATGSKENFVLLLLPLSILLGLEFCKRRERGTWSRCFLFLVPLGMAIAVWGSILTWVAQQPRAVDIYGQSMSLAARTRVLFRFFYEGQRAGVLIAAFFLFYVGYFYIRCRPAREKLSGASAKNSFIAMLTIAACILGNFIFHNGETSLLLRYAFMEQLLFGLLFLAALFPLREILCEAWRSHHLFRRHALRWSCALGAVCLVSILVLSRLIAFQIQRTREFDAFLNRLNGSDYNNVQVVNLGPPISSYELYISLKRFAEGGLLTPKVYYFPAWDGTDDTFSEYLKDFLVSEAANDPAPPLTPGTALIEFSTNGWYRVIEHSSPHREINQTILLHGWQQDRRRWEKFWRIVFGGIVPADRGRRSQGNAMALALPVDQPSAFEVAVGATPFNSKDRQSDIVFCFNGAEVKRTKLYDTHDYKFKVSSDLARNSPLHQNLMLLEARIENSASAANGLIVASVDILPLAED